MALSGQLMLHFPCQILRETWLVAIDMLTVLHGGSRVCTYYPVHGHVTVTVEVTVFIVIGMFIIVAQAHSEWPSSVSGT